MAQTQADEQAIFEVARKIDSRESRNAYLQQMCADDAALQQRVAALLRAYEESESFLESSPPGLEVDSSLLGESPTIDRPITERPGSVIGPYKLLQQIGEGGMGVVFMAEQTEPIQRTVALKIIKPGMDTRQVIARFEAERQALAMMDHPNIAKVLDAGTTNGGARNEGRGTSDDSMDSPALAPRSSLLAASPGRPYFVMDLVKGVPITEYCDQQHLPVRARLELMATVCHAVQHAHQKGIIHRDLKPSNVLVAEYDGKPVPKVIDFGVAKATAQRLTERTMFTEYGQLIGTFEYMSPEQARFNQLDVDTRSDIYSLGVLLYEVLAGSTPLEKERLRSAAFDEVLRIICEEEPPRPSLRLSQIARPSWPEPAKMAGLSNSATIAANRSVDPKQLTNLLRGELDWIVMKCLEKDRNRRYETASGLADDIEHHLNDEPVAARPASSLYRFRKTVRRNKIAFGAGGAVIAALMLGLSASTWMFFQERFARQRAVAAEQAAKIEAIKSQQVAQFLKDMLAGAGPAIARGRDTTLLREIVEKTAERIGKDLKDQPGVEAELRGIIGWVYDDLGEHKQGEAMFRQALAINKTSSGSENFLAADSLLGLAWMLHNQGRPAEAEAAFRESVAIRRKLFGDDDLRTAGTLGHLAFNLAAQGKLSEAETMFCQSLVTLRKYGDDGDVAFSLNGLGGVLHDQGKLAEAEATYREALAMRRKVFGSDHRLVAGTLSNLARLLQDHGKLIEAELMFREAVATRRKLLGNEHPDLYGGLIGLAQVLQGQGKLAEAEAVYREAVTVQRKVVESAPNNPLALSRLAWLLSTCPVARLRDPGRAVALASQAVEIAPQEAESWNTLGVARYRAGEWQAAVDALDKSIGLPKRGDASNWFFLSMAHGQLGHKEEARSLYEKAVERMDKNQPKNEELLHFRAEAAELLGIPQPQPSPSAKPKGNANSH